MKPNNTVKAKADQKFRCPACQSPIYSQRRKVCGQCGAPLPKALLLTEAQIQALDKQVA